VGIYVVIGALGLVTGFLSGLLGIGGGIVMAPLLLYVPQVFGFEPLGMRVVAGLTIVQALVACLAGALVHRQFRVVSSELSIVMGTSIFVASAVGGAASGYVSNQILLVVFAGLAFTATLLILMPVKAEIEDTNIETLKFSRFRAISAAAGVGLLGGLVGQGGSFVLIPLMISYVHIPTRVAIGSNLAIVFLASVAGALGKAFTGQIEWSLTIPLVVSIVPAARFGSLVSKKTPVATLRRILAIFIGIATVRIGLSVFGL
jgi:hypothetical protein